MCNWAYVTLFSVANYCIGIHECQLFAHENGIAMARAPKIRIDLKAGIEYTIFTDARDPSLANITKLIAHTAHNTRIVSLAQTGKGIVLEPWTVTAFRVEAKLTPTHDTWLLVTQKPPYTFSKDLSLGVCSTNSLSWHIEDFFLLPLSRIRAQIWRKAAIGLSWPLVVLPIVVARRQKPLGLFVVLESLIISDVFFWIGFGFSALEITDSILNTEFAIWFVLFLWTTGVAASIQWWYGRAVIIAGLFLTSFLWSSFYYTPLALGFACFYDYSREGYTIK